ncbi:MAG TPA: hypothetical protein VFQ17_13085 [Nocardioides sp.]|nr:hypothetical protein [Nocardioides sp.]
MTETMTRRLVAELLGTGLLVAVVVGSGIAAQRLSTGDVGLQLLENSTATFLGLTVLILVFGPSPGHTSTPSSRLPTGCSAGGPASASPWPPTSSPGIAAVADHVVIPTPSPVRPGARHAQYQ